MRVLLGFATLVLALLGVLLWRLGAPIGQPVPASPSIPEVPAGLRASEPPPAPDGTSDSDPLARLTQPQTPTSGDAPAQSPQVQGEAGLASRPAVRWATDTGHQAAHARLDAARRALSETPDSFSALCEALEALRRLERWEEACRILARLRELEPHDAALSFEYAGALMRVRRWVDAIPVWQALIETDQSDARAWYNLAICRQGLRHLADARRAWDRAIQLSPQNADAYAHRGEVSLDLHEWSAAAEDFSAALRLDPGRWESTLNLSLALWRLGRWEKARAQILELLERSPRHVPALNRLAELSWDRYQRDPELHAPCRAEVIELCQRSLEIDPDQPSVRALLVVAREAAAQAP